MTFSSTGEARSEIWDRHHSGRVNVREVFVGTLYFRKPHLAMLDEVADCIRGFFALVPDGGLEYYYDDEGDPQNVDAGVLDRELHELFYGSDSAKNATLQLDGMGMWAPSYALDYLGSANENPDLRDEAGTLRIWVPRSFFLSHQDAVLSFFAEVATALPLSCGEIGLGLSGEDKQRKQALAIRHPGLGIADPGSVSIDIGEKASGVSWQTLLGPSLTSALGGVDAITKQLVFPTVVDPLPLGGCRITADVNPQIGDVNRHDFLPSHRQVARMLDAAGLLHIPQHCVYFEDRDGMADRDAMERWHRRWL